MDPEPEVIRQQIEETRSSLTDKLETLENQVKDTVTNVTDTVKETIEGVQEKVHDTVEAVTSTVHQTVDTMKRTFDIPYQVQRHPHGMTGGSLLVGVALGYLLGGRRHRHHEERWEPAPARDPGLSESFRAASYAPPPGHREESQPGLFSKMLASFQPEIEKVKEVAVGTLMGLMRDSLKRALPPSLAANVEEIMDSVTRKAGGRPVEGPVTQPEPEAHVPDGRHTAGYGR